MIHGGLYYPSTSLKAKFCVEGKKLLYKFCKDRQITHRRCGKLIVATNQEQLEQELPRLQERASQNGVEDTRILSREDVRLLEPEVECCGALMSPSTGVVDSHSYFLSLLADAEDNGATLALHTSVDDATIVDGKVREIWDTAECSLVCWLLSLDPPLLLLFVSPSEQVRSVIACRRDVQSAIADAVQILSENSEV